MIKAKAFQKETVKVACLALRSQSGSRRFLVSDEAGLGKTVVAQKIIEEFRNHVVSKSRILNIVYVCSNLAIAKQNQDRLLGFMTKAFRKAAAVEQDRLSLTLLPQKVDKKQKAKKRINVSVHLYAVTPKTSQLDKPSRGRGAGGTTTERALCFVMTKRALGYEIKGLRRALALRVSISRFKSEVKNVEVGAKQIVRKTVDDFKLALRRTLLLEDNKLLGPKLKQLANDDRASLVRYMRLALANVAIARINPDLVIFDEFQRFEDLIEPDERDANSEEPTPDDDAGFREEARRLLQLLRGNGRDRALLLLSATPWLPYRSRAELGAKSANTSDGFSKVVEFLYGAKGNAEVKKLNALLLKRRELLTVEPLKWEEIDRNREAISALLIPVMARTERRRDELIPTTGEEEASLIQADLQVADLIQFKRFHECVEKGKKHRRINGQQSKRERDLEMLVPLWNSVPLPMQSLGPKYVMWKRARKLASAAAMVPDRVERLMSQSFPHPRLRALIAHMNPESLALPWIAPSHEWWPLGKGWQRQISPEKVSDIRLNNGPVIDGKLLVFARFRAVVPAVAGLLSYHVEASSRSKNQSRQRSYKRDGQSQLIRPESTSSFELFHPCAFLIEADPIVDRIKVSNVDEALSRARRNLERYLKSNGVRIVASEEKSRQLFMLIVGIEAHLGHWGATKDAWKTIDQEKHVRGNPRSITEITEAELAGLAHLGISSPGVVLGRVVRRHWDKGLSGDNFKHLVSASWSGLRTRFDEPWVARALRGPKESFPTAIRRAVLDGNLESTLDEHFWFLKETDGRNFDEIIQEFERSISLRKSSAWLHYGKERSARPTLQLRCHVATPFSRPDHTDEEHVRPDDVRRAFNSPFWPHVLVTTSIGQEGLDFHPWCQTLLHWDPPPGPVALEQREGRVDRYASLAIRRAVASDMVRESNQIQLQASPWENLAKRASDTVTDFRGLHPWWIYRSARPVHLRFALANSEIMERWNSAHEERGHYRLVLGMPNQNDLLGELRTMRELDHKSLQRACLDFAPINRTRPNVD